jgi:Ca-activated chloride channel family protein
MGAALPQYWIWMLGIPVILGVLYLTSQRVAQITYAWFSPDQYSRSYPATKALLRGTGFVLLFFALPGPYLLRNEEEDPQVAREIYILLDVSASMNTQDVAPSRLGYVREELKELVRQLSGNKIGLIVFADQAYVQCPLTIDEQALLLFLEMAESAQFSQTGTQFRSALVAAMDRFLNTEVVSATTTRAIVLVSDGGDHGDSYASLLERMKLSGIKLFPVGVGTEEGGPVPQVEAGQITGYKQQADGSTVISRLEEAELVALGSEFQTPYFRAGDSSVRLADRLAPRIREMRVAGLENDEDKVRRNVYQLFVFLSVGLLVASLFIMPIRKI